MIGRENEREKERKMKIDEKIVEEKKSSKKEQKNFSGFLEFNIVAFLSLFSLFSPFCLSSRVR